MLTSYADDEALVAAVMAGASGYVLKQVGASSLVETPKGGCRQMVARSLLDGTPRRGASARTSR